MGTDFAYLGSVEEKSTAENGNTCGRTGQALPLIENKLKSLPIEARSN